MSRVPQYKLGEKATKAAQQEQNGLLATGESSSKSGKICPAITAQDKSNTCVKAKALPMGEEDAKAIERENQLGASIQGKTDPSAEEDSKECARQGFAEWHALQSLANVSAQEGVTEAEEPSSNPDRRRSSETSASAVGAFAVSGSAQFSNDNTIDDELYQTLYGTPNAQTQTQPFG